MTQAKPMPKRIHAAPEGEFGQGLDAVRLAVWTEGEEYTNSTEYVRADLVADLREALQRSRRFLQGHDPHLSSSGIRNSDLRTEIDAALSAAPAGGEVERLLEALRGLLSLHEARHNHPAHAAARAAITKAEGGEL